MTDSAHKALRILLLSLFGVSLVTWFSGMFITVDHPWLNLGIAYAAITLEMIRQKRTWQARLVIIGAVSTMLLRLEHTSMDAGWWMTAPLWVFFLGSTMLFLIGILMGESMYVRHLEDNPLSPYTERTYEP